MSKLGSAVDELLAGSPAVARVEGVTAGLGGGSVAVPGIVAVTESAAVAVWSKLGLRPKVLSERFSPRDILEIAEADADLPGLAGALARKNASHPIYRALGKSSGQPAVTLRTRRGDFTLHLKKNQRAEARQLYVAVLDLIS